MLFEVGVNNVDCIRFKLFIYWFISQTWWSHVDFLTASEAHIYLR